MYSNLVQLFGNTWVEGDNISYSCTGDGETDSDVISVCEGDGRWSLQTLPSCCKFMKYGSVIFNIEYQSV